jgi:hypothetical protein
MATFVSDGDGNRDNDGDGDDEEFGHMVCGAPQQPTYVHLFMY